MRLSTYPYVLVRLACHQCKRAGSYRLARLAEAHGAEIELDDLLERMTLDCPWRVRRKHAHPFRHDGIRCFAKFTDLGSSTPPDLPPGVGGLRVIVGGRDEDAA